MSLPARLPRRHLHSSATVVGATIDDNPGAWRDFLAQSAPRIPLHHRKYRPSKYRHNNLGTNL
jgi:hypothetical protein